MTMTIADPLGVPGAPQETLSAVLARFEGSELRGGQLVVITDTQGHRSTAGYAALVRAGQGPDAPLVVTAAAFGPRFGAAGARALADLVRWAVAQELPVRETVLNPSDFTRVLGEPDAAEVQRLMAASNPSDPGIYTTLPRVTRAQP